ncbi:hypothetical protein GHK33_26335 [Sinorhizobium meliloti]|nr:hypothetical protein [Sinorhizobium meliloti]
MDQEEVRKSSLAAATYRPWRARSQCRSAATRKAEAVLANTMMAHPRSIFIGVCLPAQSSYCGSEMPRR